MAFRGSMACSREIEIGMLRQTNWRHLIGFCLGFENEGIVGGELEGRGDLNRSGIATFAIRTAVAHPHSDRSVFARQRLSLP